MKLAQKPDLNIFWSSYVYKSLSNNKDDINISQLLSPIIHVCVCVCVCSAINNIMCILFYIQRKIFFRRSFFLYSPCHYMRAWIHILDAHGCYECGEKVHTTRLRIGQNCRAVCTRRVALMPWAIAIARDASSNNWRESATRSKGASASH